jgi:F-type H+-transporting ATPase subunit a
MDNVFPRVVFEIGGIPVRNSVISTWVMMALIVGGLLVVRKKAPVILEMIIDYADGIAAGFIKGQTAPYVPFLGTLLVFIAVANLIGIVPLMVTPTRDINTPIALALIVLIARFVFAIRAKGIGGFFKGFLSVTLPLDLIGFVSSTMSLSLRLFGNIISGEIVTAVFFLLVPIGVPLVMVALSSITGVLQAYVFTVLAASYIGSLVEE